MNEFRFEDLLGQTLTEIKGAEKGSERITFLDSDDQEFLMYHQQDCCESVSVDDIVGDIEDLLNTPITMAEEVTEPYEFPHDEWYGDSGTWTFYKLATVKGYVTIKWLGTSNGYYSESVTFEKIY